MNESKRILLLGASSYDIQGVANELAGEVLFPERASTKEVRVFNVSRSPNVDIEIQLTVAPGFMDHRVNTSPKWMKSVIQNELQNQKYKFGFHAVIVVMSYPFRWTDEERDTINFTKDVLQETNWSQHGTLVLTNGHNFKRKYPDNTIERFQGYLNNQASQEVGLQQFLNLFHDRVLILDTELEDQVLNDPQLEQFFRSTGRGVFTIPQKYIEEDDFFGCCSIL